MKTTSTLHLVAVLLLIKPLITLATISSYTWIDGFSFDTDTSGHYGELGLPNTTNLPGSRAFSSTITINHSLYLFGGRGYGSTSTIGELNDMWVFNVLTELWTWVSGSSLVNQMSTDTVPGGRYFSSMLSSLSEVIYILGNSSKTHVVLTTTFSNTIKEFRRIFMLH